MTDEGEARLGLDAHQRTVMHRVLREEGASREHVVVYLSGAHAYGFPSPDSDLDLKAIHIAPTRLLLGLGRVVPTHDRMGIEEGVEIDYTSNELGHALDGVLRGNGNFLERVLGDAVIVRGPLLDSLVPLVQRSLSRRVLSHYRGFANNQRTELARRPTVKKLLYVLRTTLTGIHLLEAGEMLTDVRLTAPAHAIGGVDELVERKRAGERTPLQSEELARWSSRLDALFDALDLAAARSRLPAESPNVAELDAWLIQVRRSRLEST